MHAVYILISYYSYDGDGDAHEVLTYFYFLLLYTVVEYCCKCKDPALQIQYSIGFSLLWQHLVIGFCFSCSFPSLNCISTCLSQHSSLIRYHGLVLHSGTVKNLLLRGTQTSSVFGIGKIYCSVDDLFLIRCSANYHRLYLVRHWVWHWLAPRVIEVGIIWKVVA